MLPRQVDGARREGAVRIGAALAAEQERLREPPREARFPVVLESEAVSLLLELAGREAEPLRRLDVARSRADLGGHPIRADAGQAPPRVSVLDERERRAFGDASRERRELRLRWLARWIVRALVAATARDVRKERVESCGVGKHSQVRDGAVIDRGVGVLPLGEERELGAAPERRQRDDEQLEERALAHVGLPERHVRLGQEPRAIHVQG